MITNFKIFENTIGLNPSDFAKIFPIRSRFNKFEHEKVARNIMIILKRTGNEFRDLSWQEYKKERLKDGALVKLVDNEKKYFIDVIRWCVTAHNAKQFSPQWDIKSETVKNAEKFNL